jgi:putative copper resistance protein D
VLLTATALHLVATAGWIGGLPYLVVTLRRQSEESAVATGRRFSRLAIASVLILISAGAVMSLEYVGDVSGFYGTSYGAMLAAKLALLALLLLLGRSNYLWLRRTGPTREIIRLVVLRSVEVEAAIGITAILAAASLTSQPPAADLSEGRVTLREIADRFTPRRPRLSTPPFAALSPATPLSLEESVRFNLPLSYTPGTKYTPDTPADIAWSEYNHHWAGICVLAIGLLALIAQTSWGDWAHHWPLAFLGLGLFLLIRADSENWPLGPRGFWESFQVAEVAQHRVFVLLITGFAIFEWRNVAGRGQSGWHALVFPAICMTGGALLLTHTHPLGNIKQQVLVEMSHTPIAILAIIAAGSRWLELRLRRKPGSLGFVWAISFALIGLMLIGYRES